MRDLTFDDLVGAARRGGPAALVIEAVKRPVGGDYAIINPAKYTLRNGGHTYVFEDRFIHGTLTRTVLLDSAASTRNRIEDGISSAIRAGHPLLSQMPRIEVTYAARDIFPAFVMSDWDLPHRAFDAHIRAGYTQHEGERIWVPEHPAYRAARASTARDISALLALSPASVLMGAWDSTRKAHRLSHPSAITGEMFGVVGDAQPRRRNGGRVGEFAGLLARDRVDDLGGLLIDTTSGIRKEFEKPTQWLKVSGLAAGPIPPITNDPSIVDGISVSRIMSSHVLSFSTLRRVGAGSPALTESVRALLAAVGVWGLAVLAEESYMRAGTSLVTVDDTVTLDSRDPVELNFPSIVVAEALLEEAFTAARTAGLDWHGQVFAVEGNDALVENRGEVVA